MSTSGRENELGVVKVSGKYLLDHRDGAYFQLESDGKLNGNVLARGRAEISRTIVCLVGISKMVMSTCYACSRTRLKLTCSTSGIDKHRKY